MPRAVWNGVVLAESDRTEEIEGNHYFPAESLHLEHFRKSDTTTECGWKGIASYYHLVAGGSENHDAAWYYASPKPEAAQIAGHVAFWKGVQVED